MNKLIALASALFFSVAALNTHAALYDRGNGMIYDSSLNITWLQDASYAKTTGVDLGLGMSWADSTAWVQNLVYGGFSDWRLASGHVVGDTIIDSQGLRSFTYDGSTDNGYNNTRSEIGHLFFELGNKGAYNNLGVAQAGYGVTHSSFVDASTHQIISFLNINTWAYWEAEIYAPASPYAWYYNTSHAAQSFILAGTLNAAWAVHDGDIANVSSVPVPAAAWLFGSGLLGLVGAARRKSA
ncbi:MAG TPA: VPLPA-CTERM sorting domain-containing protein [Spongiibacteraceae bacterium]|nr:VPLPA-CTERM sorting domain-containing protein [Spongiibacteraceae bacterium]